MDDKERQSAFMSALVTEHFVLQTAASATVTEAASRSSLYVFSLSSSLVAMGFASRSREAFLPFAVTVLSGVFFLGLFTIMRLVDTMLEYQRCLAGIARIRGYYRTLTPEAAVYFSAETGRWPEAQSTPPLWFGPVIGFLTTAASIVSLLNSIVAGAGVALVVGYARAGEQTGLALLPGVATAVVLMVGFLAYQRWRYSISKTAESQEGRKPSHPTPDKGG